MSQVIHLTDNIGTLQDADTFPVDRPTVLDGYHARGDQIKDYIFENPVNIGSAGRLAFDLENEAVAKFNIEPYDGGGSPPQDVVAIGFNYGSGFAPRINNTLPAVGVMFEYNYYDGSKNWLEWYACMHQANGLDVRPIQFTFNRNDTRGEGFCWITVGNGGISQFLVLRADGTNLLYIPAGAGYVYIQQFFYFMQETGFIGASGANPQVVHLSDSKFSAKIGFYDTAPVAKPTVTGNIGNSPALGSLLAGLETQGLIADDSTGLEYTEYVALVSQASTNAPTDTVIKNNTGATVTWDRFIAGFYRANFSSPVLITGKTVVLIAPQSVSNQFAGSRMTDSVAGVYTGIMTGALADNVLLNTPVIIRIYA